jgi:serine/threonine protein kinase
MAKVVAIGPPVNDAERLAIATLRDGLPANYVVIHNFEFKQGKEVFEIDVAVLAPHGVHLVDSKGTRGQIDVYANKWYPQGRAPFLSPLPKLRNHSKALKSLVVDGNPTKRELGDVYFDVAVILASSDASFNDPGGRDKPYVVPIGKCVAHFQNPASVPARFTRSAGPLLGLIEAAIVGKAKPLSRPTQYGSWVIDERLGGTDLYTEYRAHHAFTSGKGATALLRVYTADPYLPEEERRAQARRISNAYQALSRLPSHPGIVAARDFFPTEEGDRYILVTEDVAGRALLLQLQKPELALTLDQKPRITRDLLATLEHAHAHGVVHRNLTPGTILVGADGQTRVTGFDFARATSDRSSTIAEEIVDDLERDYQAPEVVFGDPSEASSGSDVFSLGLVLYEVFTGDRPFATPELMFEQEAVLPRQAGAVPGSVTERVVGWLQELCRFKPDERPAAGQALEVFNALWAPAETEPPPEPEPPPAPAEQEEPVDYTKLPAGYLLARQYQIEEPLGKPGAFGVVYRAIDTLADMTRAVKIIFKDRYSTVERLRKEYRVLLQVPPHPNVVEVVNAAVLPDGTPFLVFEFIEGLDVGQLIDDGAITAPDGLKLGLAVAEGLRHLHGHGVYHCDIKPRNLLWTNVGVRIIDFNVSVTAEAECLRAGGTQRYLPPDYDLHGEPSPEELADRDQYALGITLYQAITRRYPWDADAPPPSVGAKDPTQFAGCEDLAPDLVALMLKAVAPRRGERFGAAAQFAEALKKVKQVRQAPSRPALLQPAAPVSAPSPPAEGGSPAGRPNTNPFVWHLLTLYSQSPLTNGGTRGLDPTYGQDLYVETALDRELLPELLAGKYRLLVITGNAGDGKTAYLETVEKKAVERGGKVTRRLNGSRIDLDGRVFEANYDGSQDEADRVNNDVLLDFFAPFAGDGPAAWPEGQTRLVAINEGRLVDFLDGYASRFAHLAGLVRRGLAGEDPADGVVVVNLNMRSAVGDLRDPTATPLLDQMIRRLTDAKHWKACDSCDLKEKCYARRNAMTFQDPATGQKVTERLRELYTLSHLRGRLHVTLRDLRSALSFMLVGARDCDQIHQVYTRGEPAAILDSFYFNSWRGGEAGSADRLLTLLRDVDVGQATDARLDRALDFVSPRRQPDTLPFEQRPDYDIDLLAALHRDLPRDFSPQHLAERFESHRRLVAMLRRRHYFERRDEGWRGMWPYRSARRMLELVRADAEVVAGELPRLVQAINRGEGVIDPGHFGTALALQVRQLDGATLRSYRLFLRENFGLEVRGRGLRAQFVEYLPTGLVLRYRDQQIRDASLDVNLDVFEMLHRLSEGYLPSVEELQGYYLALAVFKNVLGSAAYSEVLLTETGRDFYRIRRSGDGRLTMTHLATGVV